MRSPFWFILVCKIPHFLPKSYRFGQLIIRFQKADTLRLLKTYIMFCHSAGAKYPFFYAPDHLWTQISMVFNWKILVLSNSDLCQSTLGGVFWSVIPHVVRAAFVCITVSRIITTIWLQLLSMLLIHYCISSFPFSELLIVLPKLFLLRLRASVFFIAKYL